MAKAKIKRLADGRWAVIDNESGRALAVTVSLYSTLTAEVKDALIKEARLGHNLLEKLKPRAFEPPQELRAAFAEMETMHFVENSLGEYELRRKGNKRGPPLKESPIEAALRAAERRYLAELEACKIPGRHWDVMRLTREGHTNAEIAEATGYSVRQINNIRRKYRRP